MAVGLNMKDFLTIAFSFVNFTKNEKLNFKISYQYNLQQINIIWYLIIVQLLCDSNGSDISINCSYVNKCWNINW